jgi:hypothetical protein
MEYEELKSLWGNYNNKLDNLERLNKKLILESLSKKPQRKLNVLKFKCIQSILIYPIILLIIIYANFRIENIDWKFILGCVLSIAVLAYLIYINLKTFSALKAIDLGKDSIVDSARKINDVKSVYSLRYKNAQFSMPILYAGIVLIAWNSFKFNAITLVLIIGIFIALFLYNPKGSKIHKNMIEKLDNEISELNEFTI